MGELVSSNYYDVLRVRAAAERLISPQDDRLADRARRGPRAEL